MKERILVLSLDSLGDLTLRQPLITRLLNAGFDLSVVLRGECKDLPPVIDARLGSFVTEANPYRPIILKKLHQQLTSLRESITNWNPNIILCPLFSRTFIDEWLLRSFPGARRIGFYPGQSGQSAIDLNFPALSKGLTIDHSQMFTETVDVSENMHECDKYQLLFNTLVNSSVRLEDPILTLTPAISHTQSGLLEALGIKQRGYAVISCSASLSTSLKVLHDDQTLALIQQLQTGYNLVSVLIGTIQERAAIERVANLAERKNYPTKIWIGSKEKIHDLLVLIAAARLYAGCDTGPMHFAAALNVPVMGIFGGGTYPRFLPRARQCCVVTQKLPCFHCRWNCQYNYSWCIALITHDAIVSGLNKLLSGDIEKSIDEGDISLSKSKRFAQRLHSMPRNRNHKLPELRTARNPVWKLILLMKELCSRRDSNKEIDSEVGHIRSLNTIAVDLTPILPGKQNSEVQLLTLELLVCLAEIAPQIRFVLLTQASLNEELSVLDHSNVYHLMLPGPMIKNMHRSRKRAFVAKIRRYFPLRLQDVINRFGYIMNAASNKTRTETTLRDVGVDLLFCPFTAPTYHEPGIPTVCAIHDLQYKSYPEFLTPADLAYRDQTFTEAYRQASAFSADSDYLRQFSIRYGQLDPARIRTIYPCIQQHITTARQSVDEEILLKKYALIKKNYLIYPSNFWKHKNHEMLLVAFGMARQKGLGNDIKLVCPGVQETRHDWLIRALQIMNLSDSVLFPGYLPKAELSILMANSAGMIFPSLYEGFGLPVLEAMAMGVPVACSKTTSLPEVAGGAALLFDPRIPDQIVKAMISLTQDKTLSANLVRLGKQRSVEFSNSRRMAREYLNLFLFALNNEKYKNCLIGAYSDGWASPNLSIQVAPGSCRRILNIEFYVPEWLPQPGVTVQINRSGICQGKPLEFAPGERAMMKVPIELVGGCYEIQISCSFIPAQLGLNEDQRELSVLLQRCNIESSDGASVELMSAKVSA